MLSREARRLRARKGDSVAESIEKRREMHPLLYGFSVVVLVVVVVTFVALPMAGRMGSGVGSIVFGSYDGHDIVYQPGNYFAQQQNRLSEQVRQQGQNQDVASQVEYIWYQAYQQTIVHTAMLIEAQKAGLQVSEDKVDKALLNYPGYQDNGQFSEELYRKTPTPERVQTRKMTREQLITDQFLSDEFSGLKTADQEKAFIASIAKDERSFDFVSFPFDGFPADQVKKYAEANKAQFKKIKVSRILIKSGEGEAKEIRKKLQDKSSSFEDLAKTYSKDSYAAGGGDMGWRYAYDLQSDFDNKDQVQSVFTLKQGEVSDVLKGTYGWMIYRAESDSVDPDLADQATLDTVKGYVMRYERGKVEDYFMELAGKMARRASESGFTAAAKEAGRAVKKTASFPINLQNVFSLAPVKAVPDSDTPASAAYNQDFFIRGFSLGMDQVSPPIVLDDQIVVLKLTGQRQEPDASQKLMANFADYMASQSLQADLQAELDNPKKLKDNFLTVFNQYVYRPQRSQSQ